MPAFDAGSVVEPLEYKFEAFVPGCNGVIREPSDRQVADYLAGVKNLVKSFRGQLPEDLLSGSADPAALMTAAEDLDPELVVKFHAELAGLIAALCSGEPSKEQILALPIRIRGVFYDWLQREVMSPEAAPGGGSTQAATARR